MLVPWFLIACGSVAPDGPTWERLDAAPSIVEVTWTQASTGPATVEWQIAGQPWDQSQPADARVGVNHRRIVGMPLGERLLWRVRTPDGVMSGVGSIETAPRPDRMPNLTLRGGPAEVGWPDDALLQTHVSIDGASSGWVVLVNERGQVVWTQSAVRSTHAAPSLDGRHLLYDEVVESDWTTPAGRVVETTLDGVRRMLEVEPWGGSFVELPGGRISWFEHDGQLLTATFDDPSPQLLWDCTTAWTVGYLADPYGDHAGTPNCDPWSAVLDASGSQLLFTFASKATVVAIDATTGATEWWAGLVPTGLPVAPDAEGLDIARITGAGDGVLQFVTVRDGHATWRQMTLGSEALVETATRSLGDDPVSGLGLQATEQPDGTLLVVDGPTLEGHDEGGQAVWGIDATGGAFSSASWIADPERLLSDGAR